MSASKRNTIRSSKVRIGSDLAKIDAHKVTAEELAELPEWTDAQLASAKRERNGQPMRRRGRPLSDVRKEAVKLRLDPDVLAHFRATGDGWQTRINLALRRSAKLGNTPMLGRSHNARPRTAAKRKRASR
jgi:uncharacterized protein (DUF4415 family)